MSYVLDASAFIHGNSSVLRGYTTSRVLEEIKSTEARSYLWVLGNRVKVKDPSPYYVKKARHFARDLGETRLSEADISILALALQERLPIVTDDYALQNVAIYAGIKVYDTGFGRIKRIIKTVWKCTGCGRIYHPGVRRCSICGSPVRPHSFVISVVDETK